MYRGFIFKWRMEMDSAIWDKPPLYYKLWNWLLYNVDYHTGYIKASAPRMGEAIQWEENNSIVVPHRGTVSRIINWLTENKMLVSKVSGSSCRRFFEITICNWKNYQRPPKELVTKEDWDLLQKTGSFKELKEVKEEDKGGETPPQKKKRKETPHQEWIDKTIEHFYSLEHTADKPEDTARVFNSMVLLLEEVDIETVKAILKFVTTDPWWVENRNFRTLIKLRKRNKEGELYWKFFKAKLGLGEGDQKNHDPVSMTAEDELTAVISAHQKERGESH